jgi:hypothetical protein
MPVVLDVRGERFERTANHSRGPVRMPARSPAFDEADQPADLPHMSVHGTFVGELAEEFSQPGQTDPTWSALACALAREVVGDVGGPCEPALVDPEHMYDSDP